MDELWDIARVAAYLGVSERTVYTRVRSGELPAIKVGRLWRVREDDLRRWLGEPAGRPSATAVSLAQDVPGPYPLEAGVGTVSLAAESGVIPDRRDLDTLLEGVTDPLVRRMLFVALLGKSVSALGWRAPVIVGGYAVQYYTAGDYPTVDIDLAGSSEPIALVLGSWGFEREGRHWYDPELNLVVEVPGKPLEPDASAHVIGVSVRGLVAYVLGIEDLIVDRLSACVFWDDAESCLWARTLLRVAEELDREYLERTAELAGVADKLREVWGTGR